ncbi:TonB-dependent receptor domain-containing protein [Pseudothauera rhizosphaerae]|uniref:TonB-dependent receptor n=1 Tax=Pseudothauera rhizosphaerae TaxID=2565932 RepID=A0A4S4AHB5_9RHOO|nr:TonB-dependent receptor [Pseudothauera rhizosphaerae]THF58649.1 TonB-dependent receptor [Pseudothauera rhizosphaerae]
MHPRLKPLGALLPLLFSTNLHAEATADPVVVTATRQEARVSEVLADVTVIEREEIERNAAGTIVDLLARQSGIQIATNGGPGTTASLYVRGARPDQTKVLVDGLPINSLDLTGSPLRYLPLADVERIEILRGPASTLYGADAVGGVIQIFTRRGTPGLKADGFIGYGTQDSFQANAGISGGDEHWRFRLEGSHAKSDSISAQKHATSQDADDDAYRNSGGAASLSFLPARGHELGLIYRQNEGRTHYDSGNVPANGTFDAYVDFRSKQWQLFSSNRFTDNWTSKLQYGQTTDWQKNYASWAPDGSYLETENRLLSWQNDIALPLGRALLGAERLEQEAAPRDSFVGDDEATNDSVFAGWTGSLDSHRWQLSARHDDHSQFGDKSTYAVAYGYQFTPQWRVHASYGTSFKAPSLYQLYDQWSGNAELKPEEGKNREAALIWESGNQSASVTWYLNRVENMIDWSFSTYTYQNVSRARLEGVTLAYAGQFGDWGLNAAYDWLDATDEDTDLRLGRRARHKAVVGVTKSWGPLATGVEWVGASSRYDTNAETGRLGGYGLVNLTARYAVSKALAVEGRINNLFDKDYELAQGYNTLGFNAFVGVRYTPR